jgi:CMP-2-keto-3-deoxyoctulosonic acid synthetase
MKQERCIIIPAIKKSAVIPDQLVKKMAGVTLIQRAINTAKMLVADHDIHVVTDARKFRSSAIETEWGTTMTICYVSTPQTYCGS